MGDTRGRKHLFRIGQQFVTNYYELYEIVDIRYCEAKKVFLYSLKDSRGHINIWTEKILLGLIGSRKWLLY